MSNTNSASMNFLERIKIDSTRGIFTLFALIFMVVSFLFFLILDHQQQSKSERLVERSKFKEEVSAFTNRIESETQNSLKRSLLFNVSNKEIDRFQAIYSLKTTKNLYDDYQAFVADYINELEVDFQKLNNSLTDFDQLIAISINKDGKLKEIINKTLQSTDTIEGDFLFDEATVGIELSEASTLESIDRAIIDQLFIIENYVLSLVEAEIKEILATSPTRLYVVFSFVYVLLLVILGYLIVKNLNSSVNDISKTLDFISKGELPEKELLSDGEFSRVENASNQLVNYLDDASQFAIKIGDGDFGYEFTSKSKNDALGNSLIDMRNRLQEVAREDKIRNWTNEGQAKFGEILRQHSEDIEDLGTHVITNLVDYLNASQGALFVLKEKENEEYLELLSSYAYNRKKYVTKRIEIGEGLAGQAFDEGKSIYLTDIKTDHYNIQTGLGESKPSSILIVPLKEEERIEGIIELASLNKLEKHQIEFIESIGKSIASSLSAGKVNQTTKILLQETQEKAEQMKAQEEELRQNMEELAATQEQMERRNMEMEQIQKQLTEEKYLLNALLNSSQDHIYFKDKDSKFIRVSRSMIELFNKEDESEIIGKSDFDFGFEEHAKIAFEDEQNIIRTSKPMVDAIEKETWDDGHNTWVSTTKNPLSDSNGKIVGTFGISRDITKNKLMELEMTKRKEWLESYFKFHPTAFIVLDQNGQLSFATESILAKLNKEEAIGMTFEDAFSDKVFSEFLADIDFDNTKDREVEISLVIKGKSKEKINLLAISGSKENEDGTQNIFLIQK
jgi:PAS domain S-box-containing protein